MDSRAIIIFLILILILGIFAQARERDSITGFSLRLFKELSAEDESVFLSPYSIYTALLMTYAGADGDTQKQMGEVLDIPLSPKEIHEQYSELNTNIDRFSKEDDIILHIANSIFPQSGYPFLSSFIDLLKKYYQIELSYLDFAQPEKAREYINNWVKENTGGRIEDMIPEGELSHLTAMVLANGIYFNAPWHIEFDKERTIEDDFYLTPKKKVRADMMREKCEFNYFESSDYRALELYYKNKELSMVIILPNKIDGIDGIISKLNSEELDLISTGLRPAQVMVYLPKFEMIWKMKLNEILQKMGITDAFHPSKADFGKMYDRNRARGENLYISNVRHKAFLCVSEEGTEAAAATTVEMTRTTAAVSPEFKTFKVDRPFMIYIRDNRTNTVLFMGKISADAIKK